MNDRSPADEMRSRIEQWAVDQFGRDLGYSHGLHDLEWSEDMDDDDPHATWEIVDGQGRRFEIELEATVTELTDAELTRRADFVERMKRLQAPHLSESAQVDA